MDTGSIMNEYIAIRAESYNTMLRLVEVRELIAQLKTAEELLVRHHEEEHAKRLARITAKS